jgi:hypothetical protein
MFEWSSELLLNITGAKSGPSSLIWRTSAGWEAGPAFSMELRRQVVTLLFRLAAFYLGILAVVQNNLLDILDAVFKFLLQCKLLGDLLTVIHSTILSHQNATVCGILFLMCYNLPSYIHNDSNLPDYLLAVLQCASFFLVSCHLLGCLHAMTQFAV